MEEKRGPGSIGPDTGVAADLRSARMTSHSKVMVPESTETAGDNRGVVDCHGEVELMGSTLGTSLFVDMIHKRI